MIKITQGNILESPTEAIVNTVNCMGIMGKGIALQFKQAFPINYDAYTKACKEGKVQLGKMFIYEIKQMFNPKFIINFPTKKHWKSKSEYKYIELGLKDLIFQLKKLEIKSIAIPPLGAGLGGLNWKKVRPLIEKALKEVPQIEVYLYEPKGAPAGDKISVRTNKPKMTLGRALLIRALELYQKQGYRHSLLEIQKLMYFLQEAGEKLRLQFVQYHYGPYAHNLNHVLQAIDGHFIKGYGDGTNPIIYLFPGANEDAKRFLENNPRANQHLEKVRKLIEGFETPYGMELLATVRWVAKNSPEVSKDPEVAIEKVQAWSSKKKERLRPPHIRKAWKKLHDENWFQEGVEPASV